MNKEILRLAIPNILSNLSIPLISSVDTALMGRLSGLHLGAIGLGSMIFNFIYWNFGFLRMGTTGVSAQAFGSGISKEISLSLTRAMIMALCLGLFMILFQVPIEWFSIKLLQVQSEQTDLVQTYFRIRVWAAPATLCLYATTGWLFGMQNAIYPLYLTILVNLINVVLSYILVVHLGQGIVGVAWGTVIAQYVGLMASVFILVTYYRKFLLRSKREIFYPFSAFKKFIILNWDIFLRTLCLTLVFVMFYSFSSKMGPEILAVNVVMMQFVNWMSYGIDGFAFASESLVGKYKGAENYNRISMVIRYSFRWGLIMAVFFSLSYAIGGDQIFRIFTDRENIISVAHSYLILIAILPLAGYASYIWDGIYIGLTASKSMRNAMLISLIFFVLLQYPMRVFFYNYGLWVALICFLLFRALIQSWYFKRFKWQLT